MSILRELYHRVVIWQPATAFVAEAGPTTLLLRGLIGETVERVIVADGAERPIARRHEASLLHVESSVQEHLRLMQRLGCRVRMVALAANRHLLWYEPALLDARSDRQGVPGYAADSLMLASDVFTPGIHQGADLLTGIPWECTSAQLYSVYDPDISEIIPGTIGSGETFDPYILADTDWPGYVGPYWQAEAGDSVGACGTLTGGPAVLEMELPIGGASLKLVGTGQIEYLDYFGNLLKTVTSGTASAVPGQTMFFRVTITAATERPRLEVTRPGAVLSPRSGDCASCSSRATVLCDWDVLTDSSYWLCPDPDGLICIVVGDNAAPYIYDCPPLAGSGETPSGGACPVCLEADATLGGDGIWRFSVLVADDDSDPFTITSITWESAGPVIYPAGTFAWTINTRTTETDRTQIQIDFRVVDSAFTAADTITFTINANDGAGNTPALTYTLEKTCAS